LALSLNSNHKFLKKPNNTITRNLQRATRNPMNDYHHFKFTPSVWIVPLFLLILIWSVFFFENSFNIDLSSHGILPRTFSGLQGVFFSPFLHGDLNHIANNSIPLFILTTALIYFYRDISLKVLCYGIILSGIITWVIGRNSFHIGASSLIYVLVSFIFFSIGMAPHSILNDYEDKHRKIKATLVMIAALIADSALAYKIDKGLHDLKVMAGIPDLYWSFYTSINFYLVLLFSLSLRFMFFLIFY
jgi:membrane associated rhomboid family serine protease